MTPQTQGRLSFLVPFSACALTLFVGLAQTARDWKVGFGWLVAALISAAWWRAERRWFASREAATREATTLKDLSDRMDELFLRLGPPSPDVIDAHRPRSEERPDGTRLV